MASIALAVAVVWACSDGGPAPTEVDPYANASLYQANAPGGGGGKVKGGELPTGCVVGQVAIKSKSLDPNNEEWICANDRDRLGDLGGYPCTDGQIPKWDASLRSGLGDWYCAADNVGGGGSVGPTIHFVHYQGDLSGGVGTLTVSPGLMHMGTSGSGSQLTFQSASGESLAACAMVTSWNKYFANYTRIEAMIGNPAALPNQFFVQGALGLNGSYSWSLIVTCP
jgi:hypothetical protein